VNTVRRYFTGHTRWYNSTETLWLLWIYLLTYPLYHFLKAEASFGVLTRKRINLLSHENFLGLETAFLFDSIRFSNLLYLK
jgi:hypothetical protein